MSLGSSTTQQRYQLAELIASNWSSVCSHLGIEPRFVEMEVCGGAAPIEFATKLVEKLYNANCPITRVTRACELAGWHPVHVNRIFNSTGDGVAVAAAPKVFATARNSSFLELVDKKQKPTTMRSIVHETGNKTTAIMLTSLGSGPAQPWKKLLLAEQSDPVMKAAFLHLLGHVEKSTNPAFALLTELVASDRFGNMTPVEFVEALFMPVNELKDAARKIVAEFDDANDKQQAALESKTAALIGWRDKITQMKLGLRDGYDIINVLDALKVLGVANEDHLKHVTIDDFVGCGFNKISASILVEKFGQRTQT